jgi:hypothetical protein
VDDAERLGANTLDELLRFLTEQTYARLKQLRDELSTINKTLADLERRGSQEARQLLLNLADEKRRELEAHDKVKPDEVQKPAADPSKEQMLEEIAVQIASKQDQRTAAAAAIKQKDVDIRAASLRQAVADRILGRLRNFEAQYEKFVTDATPDSIELKLSPRALVRIVIDKDTPMRLLSEAKAGAEAGRSSKATLEAESKGLLASLVSSLRRLFHIRGSKIHYSDC